jgi:phage terminase large subunit
MQSSTARADLELKASAVLELRRRESSKSTVFGIVCPQKGLLYSITKENGDWFKTDRTPSIYIAKKLEPVVKSTKRFIVLLGGRGSSKSVGVADICIADAKDTGAKTYCLREFQSSIKNSVHSLIKAEIDRFGYDNFEVLDQSIKFKDESVFEFAGLARNIDSVKSTHGFRRFAVEEAQFISQASLDALTPTIRQKPKNGLPNKFCDDILSDIADNDLDKVSIVFIANPQSKADPFSKRFIEPFKTEIDKHGFYEDDLHLIVKVNYDDNPWYDDSGLETERLWDYKNRSRAYYDHRWLAGYNDTVEDAIIKPEWFDAAVDAHKIERLKKAFEPHGALIAAHDPSDEGKDAKGFALRHGSIIKKVCSREFGEIDEGCDWATNLAIKSNANWFVWDGDGMGTGLKRQVSTAFNGTGIKYHMFRGSLNGSGQDNAKKIYQPQTGDEDTEPKTYAETFKNNRAQFYTDLAVRFYNTYRCVVKGEYIDPDEMISIDSEGAENITGLRSEICRIPKKDNQGGLIQIMSKQEMAKLGIDSPNEADSVMMTLFKPKQKATMEPLNYPNMSVV